jgi:hypothetical protein
MPDEVFKAADEAEFGDLFDWVSCGVISCVALTGLEGRLCSLARSSGVESDDLGKVKSSAFKYGALNGLEVRFDCSLAGSSGVESVSFDGVKFLALKVGALTALDVDVGRSLARSSGVESSNFDGVKLLAFKVAGSFHVSRFSDTTAASGPTPKTATEGANWPPVGLAWLLDARRSSGLAFNNCPRTLSMACCMISSSLSTSIKLKKDPSSGLPFSNAESRASAAVWERSLTRGSASAGRTSNNSFPACT